MRQIAARVDETDAFPLRAATKDGRKARPKRGIAGPVVSVAGEGVESSRSCAPPYGQPRVRPAIDRGTLDLPAQFTTSPVSSPLLLVAQGARSAAALSGSSPHCLLTVRIHSRGRSPRLSATAPRFV